MVKMRTLAEMDKVLDSVFDRSEVLEKWFC